MAPYSKLGVELTIRGCTSMADSEPDTNPLRAVPFVPPGGSALKQRVDRLAFLLQVLALIKLNWACPIFGYEGKKK